MPTRRSMPQWVQEEEGGGSFDRTTAIESAVAEETGADPADLDTSDPVVQESIEHVTAQQVSNGGSSGGSSGSGSSGGSSSSSSGGSSGGSPVPSATDYAPGTNPLGSILGSVTGDSEGSGDPTSRSGSGGVSPLVIGGAVLAGLVAVVGIGGGS